MANLETLELTISANAESATQGIGKLVRSLSALSTAIGKSVSGLKLLNNELKTLKGFGSMRMPSLGKATGATKAVSAAQRQAQAIEEWKQNRKPLTFSHFRDNVWTEEQERAANPQWFNNYESPEWQEKINANKAFQETTESAYKLSNSMKEVGEATEIPVTKIDALKMKLEGLDLAMDKASAKGDMLSVANKRLAQIATADKIEKESNAMNSGAKEAGFFATAFDKAKGAVSNFGKTFSRVGRIFSTMLIRTAIRSLMKAFTEAWGAAYQFSKGMGGQFAESVDKAKTLLAGTATNIISAFSPALSALIPVMNAVAGIINYLCNAIRSLFALLGMGSDLWGASTDAINKYSKAAGGAGGKNKEMLASFDELNVISQESGGGGGGGGASYINGMFSDVITDEMAKIQLIVSESLLALGLILACTGHIGIGAALMAIGAAGIAKTVFEDWNKLPSEMQGTLATIMSIIGVSTLALGAILAFSGANIPLGIGLMIMGAANLAAVAYVNFKNGLPDNIRSTITTIEGIVGVALLALGAILAFSGARIGLGIGLMAVGALSLGSVVALNWDNLSKKIENPIAVITTLVSGALLVVGSILAFSGVKVGLGVALMAAGAAGLATSLALNWNYMKNMLKGTTGLVVAVVSGALLAIGSILAFSGVKVGLGIGLIAAGAVGLATTATLNWNFIENMLTGTIGMVTAIVSAALLAIGAILAFSGIKVGLGIALIAAGAVGLATTVAVNWNFMKNIMQGQVGLITGVISGALLVLGAILAFSGVNIPLGIAMMAAGGVGLVAAIAPNWESIKSTLFGVFNTIKDTLIAGWNEVKKVVDSVLKAIKDIFSYNGKSVNYNVNMAVSETSSGSRVVADAVTKNASNNQSGSIVGGIVNTFNQGLDNMLKAVGLRASGGTVERGELFIAQEAGAELIGTINGKTSVANQEQIIEGISSGVERANAEQNVLLRQQNELLRGILEKEYAVKFGASASFGRTVQQSLDMYNTVGG